MAEGKNNKERFEELCTAYVLGALDSADKQEFKELLRSADSEQLHFYEDMMRTSGHIGLLTTPQEPPEAVKANILNYARNSKKTAKQRGPESKYKGRSATIYRWISAVAAVLLVAAIVLSIYTNRLKNELNQKNQKIKELTSQVQQKNALLSVLAARKIDVVVLNGQNVNPRGYGKIIWDPKSNTAVLQVSNLPPVPKNKDYQLWAIKGNKPISAGVFAVHHKNQPAFFKVNELANVSQSTLNAFAVTLEPKGGVPQPTGKMYLLGKPTRD